MGLGELDERTDIYSFGVMLYEMAVGKVPFSADTPFSIIHDHIYTPLPLPRTVNPSVPESVELVLLKALAKEREDRYPDANALAKAFTQAVQSEPDAAPVVIAPEPDRTYVPTPELEPEPQVAESISSVAEVETAVPAVMGVVDETSAQEIDEVQPVDDAPASFAKKRRFRWWFLPLGIIIIAACCFCGFIALNNFEDFPDRDKPAAEQLPEGIFPEEQDSSTYEDAQSWVDEAPEDPYAWLSLAEAHWVAQHHEEAWGALNCALELAKDDADFYFDTAEELADRGFWVEAAQIYLRGFQSFHNGEIPDEMLDDFHEAVYWATDSPEAEHIVPIPEIAKVDIPMERVATARYLFHFGDEEEALKILERVLIDIKPDMPEALYLQSEIFYAWGDVEAYFNILRELQAREDTPDWIREDIELLLHESIQMREQAQAQVDADPENPYVYLPLYEWYLGVGLYQEANDVIQLALKIAGDDPEIAQLAGEIATRYGAWLDAAQLFAYAGQLEPGELPPELAEIILQALYYGAVEEGAPEIFGELETYLPEGERGILRAAYRDALMARYKLYYEDADEAKAIIEDVVGRMPKTLALPRLVQAEVYLFTDDIRQGEAILLELQNSRTAPPWVQDEVQFMLEAIKPDL